MDKRALILEKLMIHNGLDKKEKDMTEETINFINENYDCFERSLKIGHVTGSAWIVDEKLENTLLTHHAKLDKWFQLGGHSDGDWNTFNVAFREALEESGLKTIYTFTDDILDVDVHTIPGKGEEPEHKHYDIRFIFVANKNEDFITTEESKELAWVELDKVSELNPDPALLRMIVKTKNLRNLKLK